MDKCRDRKHSVNTDFLWCANRAQKEWLKMANNLSSARLHLVPDVDSLHFGDSMASLNHASGPAPPFTTTRRGLFHGDNKFCVGSIILTAQMPCDTVQMIKEYTLA